MWRNKLHRIKYIYINKTTLEAKLNPSTNSLIVTGSLFFQPFHTTIRNIGSTIKYKLFQDFKAHKYSV